MDEGNVEVSVVMPCLNEAETLEICITKAKQAFERLGILGEIVIADNGSTDGSQKMATDAGARVVNIENKGYGSALLGGIAAARSTYILMGDADDSYDFSHMPRYVEKLREGYDLVMGNRFKGGIAPGAMPFLHRYLGNPVLSWIGRLFFNCPSSDVPATNVQNPTIGRDEGCKVLRQHVDSTPIHQPPMDAAEQSQNGYRPPRGVCSNRLVLSGGSRHQGPFCLN